MRDCVEHSLGLSHEGRKLTSPTAPQFRWELPLGCEPPSMGRLPCPGWANSCASQEGAGQGRAYRCREWQLSHVGSAPSTRWTPRGRGVGGGGGRGTRSFYYTYLELWGQVVSTACGTQISWSLQRAKVSGGVWWPSVTGEGTAPGGAQKFRCSRRCRQGLHGSPATRGKGAAAPRKGAGETSKYSLPFVKKINIGFRGKIRTARDYIH